MAIIKYPKIAAGTQKTVVVEGKRLIFQMCDCGEWFQKTRIDKESCKNSCAQKKSTAWQERNRGKK